MSLAHPSTSREKTSRLFARWPQTQRLERIAMARTQPGRQRAKEKRAEIYSCSKGDSTLDTKRVTESRPRSLLEQVGVGGGGTIVSHSLFFRGRALVWVLSLQGSRPQKEKKEKGWSFDVSAPRASAALGRAPRATPAPCPEQRPGFVSAPPVGFVGRQKGGTTGGGRENDDVKSDDNAPALIIGRKKELAKRGENKGWALPAQERERERSNPASRGRRPKRRRPKASNAICPVVEHNLSRA